MRSRLAELHAEVAALFAELPRRSGRLRCVVHPERLSMSDDLDELQRTHFALPEQRCHHLTLAHRKISAAALTVQLLRQGFRPSDLCYPCAATGGHGNSGAVGVMATACRALRPGPATEAAIRRRCV